MAVRFAVLPPAAVSPAVVEVKTTPVHHGLGGGGGASGPGRRRRRVWASSTVHLILLLHFVSYKILIYSENTLLLS